MKIFIIRMFDGLNLNFVFNFALWNITSSYFLFSASDIPLIRVSGHELTKDYLEKTGFNHPIIIDRKDGLDLKVPPSNFTIQDVENYVGECRASLLAFGMLNDIM